MKGLLIKDLRLVLKRKNSLLVFLPVCAMIAFSTGNGGFAIGYTAFLLGVMGLSTLAFDERGNGFPFLFSLPVDTKTYVNEKFLFCILADLAGLALGCALFLLVCAAKGRMDAFREDIVYALFYLPGTVLLILSVLTVQMIFGIEKSRIVTLVVYGALFAISALLVKTVGPIGSSRAFRSIPACLKNPYCVAAIFAVFAAGGCAVLYLICRRTMRNKQF